VELTDPADGSRHPAYQLTTKGRSLGPVLASIRDWGLKWEKNTQVLSATNR
jgi:DNA-binding HxlR family transcriptional regulator